jgi:hypothetical protein
MPSATSRRSPTGRGSEFLIDIIPRSSTDDEDWLCAQIRRPDPLFRLPGVGHRLWFDARWPLPDPTRPLRVLTAGIETAGWSDLAPAHGCLAHVHALASVQSLVGALKNSARPDRWGGVVVTRGGGPGGHFTDWRRMFDDGQVVEAVRAVQATGLPVLVGVGHEADRCALEEVADFSWPTPSMLGATLNRWQSYLAAEQDSADDGLESAVYSQGRAVRQDFDDAWLRARSRQSAVKLLLPERRWPGD